MSQGGSQIRRSVVGAKPFSSFLLKKARGRKKRYGMLEHGQTARVAARRPRRSVVCLHSLYPSADASFLPLPNPNPRHALLLDATFAQYIE